MEVDPHETQEGRWVREMEATVASLRAEVHRLTIEQGERPRGTKGTLKMNSPEVYSGRADVSEVREWVYRMEQMFAAEALIIGGQVREEVKMQYASTYLSGMALAWYRETQGTYKSWAQMSLSLQRTFLPPNWESDCREHLMSIRQTGTVRAYTERFQELLLNVPSISKEEKIAIYVKGLKPKLKLEVRLKLSDNTSLFEVIRLADVAGAIFERDDKPIPVYPNVKIVKERAVTMRDDGWKDVRCHKCNKLGHYAGDCRFNGDCRKCGKHGHVEAVCKSDK